MKILLFCLLLVPGVGLAQENYQYRKGEIQKVVLQVSNSSSYHEVGKRGNRVQLAGKWRYFKGDSIVLLRVPCENLSIPIQVGNSLGSKKGDAACPVIFNYNYKDSTSCLIFLNRSASLEP